MNRHLIGVWAARSLMAMSLAATAWGGSFGKVVIIGGHAADLALDEGRGVLYVANFTANRIEVMSLADDTVHTSINVAAQPGSISLSPDGQYLLVGHFGNYTPPSSSNNSLTLINLNNGNAKQTFALGYPPLGVAFGLDGQALVVTSNEFLLFDPVSGATQYLDSVSNVAARTLPQPLVSFPLQITRASLGVSGDGLKIYGLADNFEFRYDVSTRQVVAGGYISSPPMGPRVMSVSRDGAYHVGGWALNNSNFQLLSEFPNITGALNLGGHVIDSDAGIIYAQLPEMVPQITTPATAPPAAPTSPPNAVLTLYDADNLTVRERLLLPENLAGRAILNSARDVVYAVSDSGVLVLPVGALNQRPRVVASQEDLVFRGNFCDRRVATQNLAIVDPGGGTTDFVLTPTIPGITIAPASGMTPAVVQVRVDPNVFTPQKGTVTGHIKIRSAAGINLAPDVRVLINNREPDQRGTFICVPGKLVDLLADPIRDRFYVIRQDKNQVLVFDSNTYSLIATLRTANTPTQLAVTFDRKFLLIGHDDAQQVYMYDLDSFEQQPSIMMPGGHYPRSVAASGNAILAASRVAGPKHMISRLDLVTRSAVPLPSLGIYNNDIHMNTNLVASPNGSSILAVMPDGNVMLYSASADTFTISRKDFTQLAGSYAASSFDQFVVDNNVLNASLVPVKKLENGTGASSGFAFVDQYAFRTTTSAPTAPGVVQRVDLPQGNSVRPTRMTEAPLTPAAGFAFTRTLAPLYSRTALISLTVSGITVLAWNYDAAVAPPRIDRLVNAADQTASVAPGGLFSLYGASLSPVNIATREMPLPTALGESCLMVNGVAVPLVMVSSAQINGQLPFNVEGSATMVLRTPGGVSDNYLFTIWPAAPSVFRTGTAGPDTGLPTVMRVLNNEIVTPTNPIHPDDQIIIYATGMGRTSPAVDAGLPAPSDPPPTVLIPTEVTLGGVALNVTYAGLAAGQVGVYRIDASVPSNVPVGVSVPLTINQDGNATTLQVRVVK